MRPPQNLGVDAYFPFTNVTYNQFLIGNLSSIGAI